MLHNIEPVDGSFAVRRDAMKLVYAPHPSNSAKYAYWYGPHGPVNDTDCSGIAETTHHPHANEECDVTKVLTAIGRGGSDSASPRPLVVHCGKRPPDFYTNCDFLHRPCLFNITADPCEYHNVADQYPNIVEELLYIIDKYNQTAVPIRNKLPDPRANPKYFSGVWSPWLNASLIV